jgi:hypothetical protein
MRTDLIVSSLRLVGWMNNKNMYKSPVIFIKSERSRNKVNVPEGVFSEKNFSLG